MSAVPYPGPKGADGKPLGFKNGNQWVRVGKYLLTVAQLPAFFLAYRDHDGTFIPSESDEEIAERKMSWQVEPRKRREV